MTLAGRPPPIRLSDAQRLDWLRLIRSEGVGPRTFRKLVNHFGGAGEALRGLPDLARQRGLAGVRITTQAEAEDEWERCRALDVRLVATGEADYPSPLAAIPDTPPLLLVRGSVEALKTPAVGIVGSRNASAGGLKLARLFGHELGRAGFMIVSGLARGIDAAAHEAALETGTIAVLAGGHERVYPAENVPLLERMLERGAAVSEMPIGWEPRGRDFPRRNRLVSGLSLGIVLVEAARKSGSLITARFALEQGREVFAIPGSPLDPRAEGGNALIRDGAVLTTGPADVIEGLRPLRERGDAEDQFVSETLPIGEEEDPLWDEFDFFGEPGVPLAPAPGGSAARADATRAPPSRDKAGEAAVAAPGPAEGSDRSQDAVDALRRLEVLIGAAPVSADELARAAAMPIRHVTVALFELENRGVLERHAGGLVSRRAG
jgi:DNA processing protein